MVKGNASSTLQLEKQLDKVHGLFEEWQNLQPLKKEDESRLWKKLSLEWNYNSNHIEGNTLTYDETKLLLLFGQTAGAHDIREYDEMKAHDVAVKLIREWSEEKQRVLTEADIRNLNKLILKEPYWNPAITPDGKATHKEIIPGDYKQHPNSVRLNTGEIFEFAKPEETKALMGDLMEWYSKESTKIHPIILASEFHYRFIRIHPFDDGNGRVARLVVNYILMQNDFLPIIIKSADKKNYIGALRHADVGDKSAFFNYMATQLIWSMELGIKAAKGEEIEDPDDIDKEIELLTKGSANAKRNLIEINREVCMDLLDRQILPLIGELTRELAKFNELFVESKSGISLTATNDINLSIDLSKVHDVYTEIGNKVDNDSLFTTIHYVYTLTGLKKDKKHSLSFNEGLQIHFEKYGYKILDYHEKINLFKHYDDDISPEEKNTIISALKKRFLDRVKENFN